MLGRVARAGFFILLPAIGVGGALGVPVLICLAGALSFRPSLLRQAVENRAWTLLALGLLIGLAIASASWSEHAAGAEALKVAVLAPLALMFACAAAADPRLTRAGVIAAFAILAVLLVIEALLGLPLNRAAQPNVPIDELGRNGSRAASLLLSLAWAAAAALLVKRGHGWKAASALALTLAGFVSLQFGQLANAIAFAAGLIAYLAALIAPRVAIIGVSGGILLWLVAAPFATPFLTSMLDPTSLPFSWNDRVGIWSYICERIAERPWFGHGLDAARAHAPAVPVHPHSISLQIWFELGVAGVGLAALALVSGARDLVRAFAANREAAAAAAATLASLAVVANISFNLWAEWWFAAMFIGAGAVGALGRNAN